MFENNQTKSKQSNNSKRGGPRQGAGRKAGAATKKTREIADKAADEGITPLEYMLNVMRAPDIKTDNAELLMEQTAMRFEAAKAAAPYMHPRLAAVEMNANVSMNIAAELAGLNAGTH